MLITKSHKKLYKMLNMITQFNNFTPFSTIPHQSPSQRSQLSRVSFTFRCFSSSQSPTRFFVNTVPPGIRNQAQEALCEYLHQTRRFAFQDAEHISKNSPNFLSVILSKISDGDVSRELSRFFRYQVINEFEPFFESLGLSPSEFEPFLPQELMYLSDDSVMLENFNELCEYGIPRGKIGRMYKEAREIFGYESGVLASKLRAYESLGIRKGTVTKLVTCCPLLLVGEIDAEFVALVEKLKELDIERDWLGRYLYDWKTYSWRSVLETLEFLEKVGFKEERLSSVLQTYPALVIESSGERFYVMFGKLFKVGLQVNEIHSLFIDNPEMLSLKWIENIQKTLDFLITVKMEGEFIRTFLMSHMKLIGSCSLKRPRNVCKSLKINEDKLCRMLKKEPLRLFTFTCKPMYKRAKHLSEDSINHAEKSTFLLRLGYLENSDEMLKALKWFRGRGDQLQERFDCLINAGLNHNMATEIVKQCPHVLNQSKDVIEKKIRCLTETLGYPIESMGKCSSYLCYDLQRIDKRFSMYLWLRERGAAKPMLSLSTILASSEARFLKYFVDVHPEGPAAWESINRSST